MRRTDREVVDPEFVRAVLEGSVKAVFGFYDGLEPYVVPMNYGYQFDGTELKLYMHCATEGRRMSIIRNGHTRVAFEMDIDKELVLNESMPCASGMRYKCLMGVGNIRIVDNAEKRASLSRLIRREFGKDIPLPTSLDGVEVLCLDVESYSAKQSLKR
ncbi:MAG: pyridoxamine 5'-phosphate oxidase family protein [Burkholderiales bacterium]|nr:pyridoxamine 5'-phosphate oxidase family protein [Burkholderiales bacterium]